MRLDSVKRSLCYRVASDCNLSEFLIQHAAGRTLHSPCYEGPHTRLTIVCICKGNVCRLAKEFCYDSFEQDTRCRESDLFLLIKG